MCLKDFYAKDEQVISAVYLSAEGTAEIIVSPGAGNVAESSSGGFGFYSHGSKSVFRYSVPCTEKEFNSAVRKIGQS